MRFKFKLASKKQRWTLTVQGWVLLCVCVALGGLCLVNADDFLCYSRPIDADILVVEGWVPDYVLDEAVRLFEQGGCDLIITTGGPLARGYHLSRYHTYAELAAASLIKLGVPADRLKSLPSDYVEKNRTRESALEVRRWLANDPTSHRLLLVTLGPHARRSYLIYRGVLPATHALGVMSVRDIRFDSDAWWQTSAGVREITSEGIAFLYAWCRE